MGIVLGRIVAKVSHHFPPWLFAKPKGEYEIAYVHPSMWIWPPSRHGDRRSRFATDSLFCGEFGSPRSRKVGLKGGEKRRSQGDAKVAGQAHHLSRWYFSIVCCITAAL